MIYVGVGGTSNPVGLLLALSLKSSPILVVSECKGNIYRNDFYFYFFEKTNMETVYPLFIC